jgi:chromosome segregation ATPase
MVIDKIRSLLATPNSAEPTSFLELVDSTLTEGYAHALQLEAERGRIERRIGELIAALPSETSELRASELAELSERLTSANESIASLRALLDSLRERRSELRNAA